MRKISLAVALMVLVGCVGVARERLDSAVRIGWQVLMAEIGDDERITGDERVRAAVARVDAWVMGGGVGRLLDGGTGDEWWRVLEGVLRSVIADVEDPAMRVLLDGLLTEFSLGIA